jgi:hypothetical protein
MVTLCPGLLQVVSVPSACHLDIYHGQYLRLDSRFSSLVWGEQVRVRLRFFLSLLLSMALLALPPSSLFSPHCPVLRDDSVVYQGHERLTQVNASQGKGCFTLNKSETTQRHGKQRELLLLKTKANPQPKPQPSIFLYMLWMIGDQQIYARIWWVSTGCGTI